MNTTVYHSDKNGTTTKTHEIQCPNNGVFPIEALSFDQSAHSYTHNVDKVDSR
jgi:hypothetical protein